MTDEELKAIEARARGRLDLDADPTAHWAQVVTDRLALVAEVRRLRGEQDVLKILAKAVRAFWLRHPGDHVVKQGISTQGRALVERVEALR